jgi:hypothetical protein
VLQYDFGQQAGAERTLWYSMTVINVMVSRRPIAQPISEQLAELIIATDFGEKVS